MSGYAKAIVAGLVAVLSALAPVADDGLTVGEILTGLVAGLVALAATYAIPNKE